ncbi:hypothetical protein [Clostridium psychrophilum]|uniref:hypothetical protein n=1 Tax=Clostridium psychrophilum TaxID=132926 RepID=UPI001C0B96A6|nr:hypothetical protein [Clostridium psychrophilum]MBU3181008.1 hypothetical protein [Clostridium psychrophilum]
MSEQAIQQYGKSSFSTKLFFNHKVNKAIKDCNTIETYLFKNNHLNKHDDKLNLIISDGCSNEVDSSYFLCKGYTENGSITPIRKYTAINGEVTKHIDAINRDIIIVHLYEKSVYLHNYTKSNKYISGYLIDEESKSSKNKSLIFTNKKIKINTKNINKFDTISVVDDFVDKFIL